MGGRVQRQSALGQSATAAAFVTVGGRVQRQSALGQSATSVREHARAGLMATQT